MRKRLCAALVVLGIVGAASVALPTSPPVMLGIPFAKETITVSSAAVGITTTLCRVGGIAGGAETKALVQVATNSIYFSLHDATVTPGNTNYTAATNDWIVINVPSKLRMIRVAGDGFAVVTCFTQ